MKQKKYNQPWRYALSMFGLSIAGYMYTTYGTFFYTEKIGLSMQMIAAANVIYAIWDAFNDPIAGYLSDRTRTHWGRRRPWMLVAVPVFILASILFFSPPAALGKGMGLALWFGIFLVLTETGNTIATVNYHSLLPDLYREVGPRNSANSLRQALQLVGMIIGVSLVPMITSALGYTLTAIGVVILVPLVEEVLYRGLIFRNLYRSSQTAAYLVSMAAFAAIHVLGYIGSESVTTLVLCFLQYLPAGLCLAWTYTKADNIFAPIVVHAIVNAVAIGALR